MRDINARDLDNWITGHHGEDQFSKYDEDDTCHGCDGEGWIVAGCFEDTCCCADPDLDHGIIPCPDCQQGHLNRLQQIGDAAFSLWLLRTSERIESYDATLAFERQRQENAEDYGAGETDD